MFNSELYTTPAEVIEIMLKGETIENKTILEPSAGKGDIVDYLNEYGAKSHCSNWRHKTNQRTVKEFGRQFQPSFKLWRRLDIQQKETGRSTSGFNKLHAARQSTGIRKHQFASDCKR